MERKKTILITGATAGIGEATAILFAKNGWNLMITGRREERLASLKERLETEFGVKVLSLCFDVRDRLKIWQLIENLEKEWATIDVLVNNAGLALGRDDFQDGNVEDWDVMIDTNVKGLLYMSRTVSTRMVEQGFGHIINISSIAGKEVYSKGNVYCATKHAVDALSKAMRIDLLAHGIKVTSINPGAVDTEFSLVRYKGDKENADKVYDGYDPLLAEDIADTVYYAATRPAHVNINELIVTCTAQAAAHYTVKKPVS